MVVLTVAGSSKLCNTSLVTSQRHQDNKVTNMQQPTAEFTLSVSASWMGQVSVQFKRLDDLHEFFNNGRIMFNYTLTGPENDTAGIDRQTKLAEFPRKELELLSKQLEGRMLERRSREQINQRVAELKQQIDEFQKTFGYTYDSQSIEFAAATKALLPLPVAQPSKPAPQPKSYKATRCAAKTPAKPRKKPAPKPREPYPIRSRVKRNSEADDSKLSSPKRVKKAVPRPVADVYEFRDDSSEEAEARSSDFSDDESSFEQNDQSSESPIPLRRRRVLDDVQPTKRNIDDPTEPGDFSHLEENDISPTDKYSLDSSDEELGRPGDNPLLRYEDDFWLLVNSPHKPWLHDVELFMQVFKTNGFYRAAFPILLRVWRCGIETDHSDYTQTTLLALLREKFTFGKEMAFESLVPEREGRCGACGYIRWLSMCYYPDYKNKEEHRVFGSECGTGLEMVYAFADWLMFMLYEMRLVEEGRIEMTQKLKQNWWGDQIAGLLKMEQHKLH